MAGCEADAFTGLDDGVWHAKQVGFGKILERGLLVAEDLPTDLVYAGFSLGAMAAQKLAQTRPGAKGALLRHSTFPLEEFGGSWPRGVPLQIHTMEGDDWGDVDVARQVGETVEGAEVFLYPGNRHLFADNSVGDYDEGAAMLMKERVLGFLAAV